VGDDPVFSDDEAEAEEASPDEADEEQDDEADENDDEEEEFDGKSEASGGARWSPASMDNRKQRSSISNTPSPLPPKLDARAKFASNLLMLSGMHLGHIINILETQCPDALEGASPQPKLPDRLEIVIDKIEPAELFQQVSSYAAEHAIVRKRPNANPKIKDVSNRRKDRK
jgi:hypothetical protein